MADEDSCAHTQQSSVGAFAARQRHTFVLRLVVDARGDLHGMVSEPGAEDGWRPGFASLQQLMGILGHRLQIPRTDRDVL